jgi:hypothetical protein
MIVKYLLSLSVDCGVTISPLMITRRTRQRSNTRLRGFPSCRLDIMRTAFVTYIRPALQYNSVVRNLYHKQLTDLIENIQRKFTERIPSLSPLSCFQRLAFLNFVTLKLRRLKFDLIYYYRLMHNLTPLMPNNVNSTHTPIESSRSNSPYLRKLPKASNALLSSFFCKMRGTRGRPVFALHLIFQLSNNVSIELT